MCKLCYNNRVIRSIVFFLILGILISALPGLRAEASTYFKYYDYSLKKTIEYDGTLPIYIVNGRQLDISEQPAYLNPNNIAMGSVNAIFRDGLGFGIACSYKSSSKKITISYNDVKIVMKIGSKTAYVNGKETTMNAAPVRIKYKPSGIKANMVPTRFVTENLGIGYVWDSYNSTVTISKPMLINIDDEYTIYNGTQGFVKYNDTDIDVSDSPSLIISDNAMLRAREVFSKGMGVKYSYKKTTGTITFSIGELKLVMKLGSDIAYLNGRYILCPIAPVIVYNHETEREYIYVPGRFVTNTLGYLYSWDVKSGTSIILSTDNVGKLPVYNDTIINTIEYDIPQDIEKEEVIPAPCEYFLWNPMDGYRTIVNELCLPQNVDYSEGANTYLNMLNNIYKEDTVSENYNIFWVELTAPVEQLSHYIYNGLLMVELKSCISENKDFLLCDTLVSDVYSEFDSENYNTKIVINLGDINANVRIDLYSDNKLLKISIAKTLITGIKSGIDSEGEYITIYKNGIMNPVISEKGDYITIKLPDVINTVGANYYGIENEFLLSDMNLYDNNEITTLLVSAISGKKPDYYTENSTEEFTIHFKPRKVSAECLQELQLPLPEGIEEDDVIIKEFYYENRISITVPGNQMEFYQSASIYSNNEAVKQLRAKYLNDDKTEISLYNEGIMGFETIYTNSDICLRLDHPHNLYSRIIVLDAGHGDNDPGTVHNGYNEKDVNLSLVYTYCKELFDESDIKVYYSRSDDTFISLNERAAFAKKVEADLFISVHHNSNNNKQISGTSAYYSSINTSVSSGGLNGQIMAKAYTKALVSSLKTIDRGIIDKGFVVVRDNDVPAVLLEIGFMSNPAELKKIVTKKFQKKAAQAIFDTTVELFETYF